MTTRREFLKYSAMLAGAMAIGDAGAKTTGDITKTWNSKKKSGFTLWQIPSHSNTIGNSYVFQTAKGKVIVMDGGFPEEANTLRGFIGALGNEGEAWFISHPHNDHMGALTEILKNPQEMKIKHIYHSRISKTVQAAEGPYSPSCQDFYDLLDKTAIPVTDIRTPGDVFSYDDMKLKVLSVANEITTNAYNNSSMIMRVWDKKKTIVFLGDAGIECGNLALNGPFRDDLDCEYLQMAHHGQNGCDKHFYQSIKFRVCLWPTPSWVWNNDQGKGFNTGILKTVETRTWMKEIGIKEHHVTCEEGLWKLS